MGQSVSATAATPKHPLNITVAGSSSNLQQIVIQTPNGSNAREPILLNTPATPTSPSQPIHGSFKFSKEYEEKKQQLHHHHQHSGLEDYLLYDHHDRSSINQSLSSPPTAAERTDLPETPAFPLIPQPQSLLQKVVAVMMNGEIFTKYSYGDGKPTPTFVFFGLSPRSSPMAAPTDYTIGSLYWNSDPISLLGTECDEEESIRQEEQKNQFDQRTYLSPVHSPEDDPTFRRGLRYQRCWMRSIPLVSVVEVKIGESAAKSFTTKQLKSLKSHDSSDELLLRPPLTSLLIDSAATMLSPMPSPTSPNTESEMEITTTVQSTALSESFKKWTLQPLVNAEDLRLVRQHRRARRKRLKKINRDRLAAGLPIPKEDEINSDSDEEYELDEDEDEEEDLPKYTYTPPKPEHCFTVATLDRTLDLVARNTITRDLWVYGIRMLTARADTYFNHIVPLSVAATSNAISMTVSAAITHQTQANEAQAAREKDATFLGRLMKHHRRKSSMALGTGSNSGSVAASPMLGPVSAPGSPAGANAAASSAHLEVPPLPVRGASSTTTTTTSTTLARGPSSSAPPAAAPLGVELSVSCRHLFMKASASSPNGIPCPIVLFYGVPIKPGMAPLRKQSQWGLLLGRTERITPATITAYAPSSASFDTHHPNFTTRLKVRQLDRFQKFYLRVHDTSQWSFESLNSAAGGGGPPMFGRQGSVTHGRSNSVSLVGRPTLGRSTTLRSSSAEYGLEPTLRDISNMPLLGSVCLTYDQLFYALDKELVTQLATKDRLPNIATLTAHWNPPPVIFSPVSPSDAGDVPKLPLGGGDDSPSSDSGLLHRHHVLPFVRAEEVATSDLFLRDAEGRTIVTDAMLDAYKASVAEKQAAIEALKRTRSTSAASDDLPPHGRRPTMDRLPSVGGGIFSGLNSSARSQVTPLLLLRVHPQHFTHAAPLNAAHGVSGVQNSDLDVDLSMDSHLDEFHGHHDSMQFHQDELDQIYENPPPKRQPLIRPRSISAPPRLAIQPKLSRPPSIQLSSPAGGIPKRRNSWHGFEKAVRMERILLPHIHSSETTASIKSSALITDLELDVSEDEDEVLHDDPDASEELVMDEGIWSHSVDTVTLATTVSSSTIEASNKVSGVVHGGRFRLPTVTSPISILVTPSPTPPITDSTTKSILSSSIGVNGGIQAGGMLNNNSNSYLTNFSLRSSTPTMTSTVTTSSGSPTPPIISTAPRLLTDFARRIGRRIPSLGQEAKE